MRGRQGSTRARSPLRSSSRHIPHPNECPYIPGCGSSLDRHFDKTRNNRKSLRGSRHPPADQAPNPGPRSQGHRFARPLHVLARAAELSREIDLRLLPHPNGILRMLRCARVPVRVLVHESVVRQAAVCLVQLLELLYKFSCSCGVVCRTTVSADEVRTLDFSKSSIVIG